MLRHLRVLVCASACLMAAPSVGHAHPAVDEGRAAFEEAEFLAALDAFARAEASDDLSRDELAALYATRAQVHLAMGNEEPMRADLTRLAVVDPEHAFDRRAPPDLRRAYAEVRAGAGAPLRVRVEPSAAATGVSVVAQTQNDTHGLVRRVRVTGRAEGGAWETAEDAPLLIVTDGGGVEYYAEAIGPGGAVLAANGSADDPLRFASAGGGGERGDEGGGDEGVWVAVGILVGLAVVAAVAVPVAIVLTDEASARPTQVSPFTVEF